MKRFLLVCLLLAFLTGSPAPGEPRLLQLSGRGPLAIVQQPINDPWFVSNGEGQVTEFRMAADLGTIGLLAHEDKAGRYFFDLVPGQEVRLIYGNGITEQFIVTRIERYQALQPNSQFSLFRNLETNELISANDLFLRMYSGERRVVFQTCIEANGNVNWGRLFVVAYPNPKTVVEE